MYIIITLIVVIILALCYLLYTYSNVNEYFTIPTVADILKLKTPPVQAPAVTDVTFYTLPNYAGTPTTAVVNTNQVTSTLNVIGSIAIPSGNIVKLTNVSGKTTYIYSSQHHMPQGFTGVCNYIIYSKQVLFFTEPKYGGTTFVVNFGSSGQAPRAIESVIIPDKYNVTLTPEKIESVPGKVGNTPITLTQSTQIMPKEYSSSVIYTYAITLSS